MHYLVTAPGHQKIVTHTFVGDDGYLEDLFVAPEARGRGLGRALIEDLIAKNPGQAEQYRAWH